MLVTEWNMCACRNLVNGGSNLLCQMLAQCTQTGYTVYTNTQTGEILFFCIFKVDQQHQAVRLKEEPTKKRAPAAGKRAVACQCDYLFTRFPLAGLFWIACSSSSSRSFLIYILEYTVLMLGYSINCRWCFLLNKMLRDSVPSNPLFSILCCVFHAIYVGPVFLFFVDVLGDLNQPSAKVGGRHHHNTTRGKQGSRISKQTQ